MPSASARSRAGRSDQDDRDWKPSPPPGSREKPRKRVVFLLGPGGGLERGNATAIARFNGRNCRESDRKSDSALERSIGSIASVSRPKATNQDDEERGGQFRLRAAKALPGAFYFALDFVNPTCFVILNIIENHEPTIDSWFSICLKSKLVIFLFSKLPTSVFHLPVFYSSISFISP